MLLLSLFSKLKLYQNDTSLDAGACQTLTTAAFNQNDLAEALDKKVASFRSFKFEYGEHAGLLQDAYDDFLNTCKRLLSSHSSTTVLPALLEVLDNPSHKTQCFALISHLLEQQEDAHAIAGLSRAYVDSPTVFFSLIKWLKQQSVGVLGTGIIQDYVRYYLSSFDQPQNPIKELHQMLASDPMTYRLSLAMHNTRLPEAGLQSYALDGTMNLEQTLDVAEEVNHPFVITQSHSNLNRLTQIFGVHFLFRALGADLDLRDIINTPHVMTTLLPTLLRHIHAYPHLKPKLANALTEDSFEYLLQQQASGLFGLLPCSPYLKSRLQDLPIELDTIQRNAYSDVELVSDLSPLLSTLSSSNDSRSIKVFEALIDVVTRMPGLLDDGHLLTQIRRFKTGEGKLYLRVENIEKQLTDFLQHVSIDNFDSIDLEDLWHGLLTELHTIQGINFIPSTFPSNKFQLQAQAVIALLQSADEPLSLARICQALNVTPSLVSEYVSSYERLLTELLVTIDSYLLRAEIIDKLDAADLGDRNWRHYQYDTCNITQHAIHHGNLGLIQWLIKENIYRPNKNTVNTYTMTAASLGHWNLVVYMHEHYKLNQSTVNLCLSHAVELNAGHSITHLFQAGKRNPEIEHIEAAFTQAVVSGKLTMVNALISCPTKPCDTILTKGFRQALNTQQYAIARHIATCAEHNPCLQNALEHELKHAARTGRLGVILCFKDLPPDALTQQAVDSALFSATRAGKLEAIKLLFQCPHLRPTDSKKHEALREAQKKHFDDITTFLSNPELLTTKKTSDKKRKLKAKEPEVLSPGRVFRAFSCLTLPEEDSKPNQTPLLAHSFLSGKRVKVQSETDIPKLTRQCSI